MIAIKRAINEMSKRTKVILLDTSVLSITAAQKVRTNTNNDAIKSVSNVVDDNLIFISYFRFVIVLMILILRLVSKTD